MQQQEGGVRGGIISARQIIKTKRFFKNPNSGTGNRGRVAGGGGGRVQLQTPQVLAQDMEGIKKNPPKRGLSHYREFSRKLLKKRYYRLARRDNKTV
jgi:hypothetical protein